MQVTTFLEVKIIALNKVTSLIEIMEVLCKLRNAKQYYS